MTSSIPTPARFTVQFSRNIICISWLLLSSLRYRTSATFLLYHVCVALSSGVWLPIVGAACLALQTYFVAVFWFVLLSPYREQHG